ncbi:MAG: zinc-binding dehydrogenase [Thermoprotei archaeon]|nr:zinc-binding dehydrogenase [Thermoprotei archaeon]
MKAIVLEGVGEVDLLVEREVETPRVGPGEVLLKVAGCGICYRDVLARKGFMKTKTPVIPGHEVSGYVVEVGEGVDSLEKGDLVASLIYSFDARDPECSEGRENICRSTRWLGEDMDGCYAEYIKLPHWILKRVGDPGEAPPEAYSFAACVVGTVLRALKTLGGARKGECALVTGASGGVGIHAVQVARSLGLKVIGVTRSEEKARLIEKYGADNVIVYRDRFSEEARRLTEGRGPEIIVETVGGPTLDQSLRSVARGGRVMVIGNVDPRPQQVLLGLIILREVKVQGVLNSTLRELEEAINILKRGEVKPVYRPIKLEAGEVREAHKILERGGSMGRIVIKP